MSMLAMATPSPHASFIKRDVYPWDSARTSEYSSRPRVEPERVALPSIRQAFPELQLRVPPSDASARAPSSTTSPTVAFGAPEYVHSPNSNKRRRLSIEDEQEIERASRVPRLYTSPGSAPLRQQSPTSMAPRSATDSWASSARTSPFLSSGGMSSMRSPAPMEVSERAEARLTLPSLPLLSFERESAAMRHGRGHSIDDYQGRMVAAPSTAHSPIEAGPAYRQGGYSYPYHHPSRVQSLSLGAIHPFDRTPFSSGYGPQFQDYMRIGELGGMGMSGDNKQRKRRGNLPKETTDKLRAWFVAHLHHPYPTEDEKQELMRQTGLQMNQISNWFINARRRQLPTMINNARAESEATSRNNGEAKILPSTERMEFDESKNDGLTLSDGEGSAFDEDLEALKQRRAANLKRGSI